MTRSFTSVLVANRGEIAVRVIRTCIEEGLRAIAVYSETDAGAPHVRMADEAHALPGRTAAETYLSIPAIIEAALLSGAEAIHPGYGFLSESAEFAAAVTDAGIVWIGPPPAAIEALGDKVTARDIARRVGAPLVAGTPGPVAGSAEVEEFVREHGLPIAIKAAFGGGGRGMRVVRDASQISEAFEAATRESTAAFGRGDCFVEQYLERPRHVEAQILADEHGNVVVVGTRDCTLQRRHQKLVEEAPAPFLSDEQRCTIHDAAKAVCREAGYVGAGTVEFLVDVQGVISFLEVNTRLQVEHPVTEETAGVDLVSEQLSIARGEPLRLTSDPEPRGHSIEFRVNCEDPAAGFAPSPGVITTWEMPQGPGIRVDAGAEAGSEVSGLFDSMVAKLIVSGPTRASALARSRRALRDIRITGVPTVLDLDAKILDDPAFTAADGDFAVHTEWVGENLDRLLAPLDDQADDDTSVRVHLGRRTLQVALPGLSTLSPETAERIRAQSAELAVSESAHHGDDVLSPMQGTIIRVGVADGDAVKVGDPIAVLEAMKMENPVLAHRSGQVSGLTVAVGETRGQGELICRIVDAD
ncbi:acetyl/propionyl/methylcrotonyl-CoA carboxylase subunit alpha [Nocardioides sp. LHG3406-4]|uniref:acetyl/propionyl/methylcrotonyl-CoA carboxylase subunit alpha n=1 Tax=Nocardioides sp. LHG3406-4 TaxID=2804575 RepID=UPI003CF68DAA